MEDVRTFVIDGDRTTLAFAENLAKNGRLIVVLLFILNVAGMIQTWGFLSQTHKTYAFGAALAVASVMFAYLSDMLSRTAPRLAKILALSTILLPALSLATFVIVVLS